MKTIDEIKDFLKRGGENATAIKFLTEIIISNPQNEEAFIERGLLYWSCGERALAINDYHSAIALNPNSKAKLAIEATYNILDYYNKDLYNP